MQITPKRIKQTIRFYNDNNESYRSIFFQLNPERIEDLILLMAISKNSIIQFLKASSYDTDLSNALFDFYEIDSKTVSQIVKWNLEKMDRYAVRSLFYLITTGKKNLKEFSSTYSVIEKFKPNFKKSWESTDNGLLQNLINSLKTKREIVKIGYGFEKRFDKAAINLGLPFKKYQRTSSSGNTVDRLIGKTYIEISVMNSDGGSIAYKSQSIINSYKNAKSKGFKFVAILDGAGWRCRKEYKDMEKIGIPIYNLTDVPYLFRDLCKSYKIKKTSEQISESWNNN